MKNVMLSVAIIVILVWSCGTVFGKGGGRSREQKSTAGRRTTMSTRKAAEQQRTRERTRERQRDQDKVDDETSGKGKGHKQQLRALEKQIRQNEIKHRRRMARLKRIRRLAAGVDDNEIVKRIDLLLEKERYRYERKHNKINKKRERALQLSEESEGNEVKQ